MDKRNALVIPISLALAICNLAFVSPGGEEGGSRFVPMSKWPCPTCPQLVVTDQSNYLGNISRGPDSTFATWGSGQVVLECQDGTSMDVVDLQLDPSDLEDGFTFTDNDVPVVDYSASELSCELQVSDGTQATTIILTVGIDD